MVEEMKQPASIAKLLADSISVEPIEPTISAASPEAQATADAEPLLQQFRQAMNQDEREHVERIQEHARLQQPEPAKHTSRRRARAQRHRRPKLKRAVRIRAVKSYQRLRAAGCSLAEAAQRLGVKPRTLRHWIKKYQDDVQEPAELGRPPLQTTVEQRNAVITFLKDLQEDGPTSGVPTLREHFPEHARAELADIQHRYRAVWRQQHPELLHVLRWQNPGRVWAMDFAEPSLIGATRSLSAIDGIYPYLLAIRDLASGYTLCWLPIEQATAEQVQRVLCSLFALFGPPLVLKSDNGSQFRETTLRACLAQAGVEQLFSPPYWPRYNGAIEASIGSLKTRTEHNAAAHGRPGLWTRADLNAARLEANTAHPKRLRPATPEETWTMRTSTSPDERARFQQALAVERRRLKNEHGLDNDQQLDHWTESALDREALQRVLVGHDYLLFRRRRIPARI
jgi:transposase InsO family protein